MRILHVTPLYHPANGGAERHARIVSERLAGRGHEVTVLTVNVESDRDLYHRSEGRLPKNEVLGGVQVVRKSPGTGPLVRLLEASLRVPGSHRMFSRAFTADGLEFLLGFPRNSGVVRSILHSSADVVATWNWCWPLAFHGYLARRVRRFPLVGIPLFHTAERWSGRQAYGRMIDACDGLIVNTEHEGNFARDRRSTDCAPICVAGVGIDPGDFEHAIGEAFRKRHGLGDDLVVGFIGRMIPSKGVHRVVEAMTRVWAWREDVRLVLAGQRSNPFPVLDDLIGSLSPERRARVLIVPDFPEEEKAHLLDAIDVFVLPSTGESFGIAYLEAWMQAKPVIGARIGSTAMVIDHGTDGLLTNPNDPDEIGEAIITLLADPVLRDAMGRRGRAKTLRSHTWEQVVDRYEDFYAGLVR